MFSRRRGISLYGGNNRSSGISLSGINYACFSTSGGGGGISSLDKNAKEYQEIKEFIDENFMTPLIRKKFDIIRLNAFNFDYLLKKLNNFALLYNDTDIFIKLIDSIKSALEITDENEKLYEIVYGSVKDTTLQFRTTAVEFKPEFQIYIKLYGEVENFEDFKEEYLEEIRGVLKENPALTYNDLLIKLGKKEYVKETKDEEIVLNWEDMPDDPAERRKLRRKASQN